VAGRFQAWVSRVKIQGLPGGCWRRPARKAGGHECLDHGCETGMGGDGLGQDAGPPVPAVRVQLRGGAGMPGGIVGVAVRTRAIG
jgi:hypothetical protein